jgi:hypothetical protein
VVNTNDYDRVWCVYGVGNDATVWEVADCGVYWNGRSKEEHAAITDGESKDNRHSFIDQQICLAALA